MPSYKTPGVYVAENEQPISPVAAVETAVPAFIGYTERAIKNSRSVAGKAVRLSSMSEFEHIFGGPPLLRFGLTDEPSAKYANLTHPNGYFRLVKPAPYFRLYRSMQLFFNNGGGNCYVVSTGDYSDGVIEKSAIQQALDTLTREPEPSMVVIPEAVSLSAADCYDIQQDLLAHCGQKTRSRVAILDIYDGFTAANNSVMAFRNHVSSVANGGFGAAYYPWVNTVLVDDTELNYTLFDEHGRALLQRAVARELGEVDEQTTDVIAALTADAPTRKRTHRRRSRHRTIFPDDVDKVLRSLSSTYMNALSACAGSINLMPPSGAIAGLIVAVDTQRGVWKAPANVSVHDVVSPAVSISDAEQQTLNSDLSGKSVNAIRMFTGKGTLVWGARTLDGNSPEWRYLSVRRTCIMLEQSIQNTAKTVVFEPNDEPVWTGLKQVTSNFLMDLWRQGGLAGAKADEAFFVRCGLGETMTAADIAAGILKISIGVAMVRPAEFIILTVQQKMQQP